MSVIYWHNNADNKPPEDLLVLVTCSQVCGSWAIIHYASYTKHGTKEVSEMCLLNQTEPLSALQWAAW